MALSNRGTNQAALAAACEVTPGAITQWKTGKTKMSAAAAYRAAVFLGVNFLWLTEGAGPMRGPVLAAPPAPQLSDAEAALLAAIRALPEDQQTLMLFDMKTKAERALLELQLSNRPAA